MTKGRNFKDLLGQRFGRLVAVDGPKRHRTGRVIWLCKCDCGNEVEVLSERLITGSTRSCKCLRSELTRLRMSVLHKGNTRPNTPRNRVFSEYRIRARRYKLGFSLTNEEFDALILGDCYWCGREPSNHVLTPAGGMLAYNGIDRTDSMKGYEPSNCVSCCRTCNFMKNNLSSEKFLAHIKRILDNHPEV